MNEVSRIFSDAVKEVMDAATGTSHRCSRTYQKVATISLKPDVACFVQFNGDYSGLCIMNFSGAAALECYRRSMLHMGMPEEELATDFSSDDVVNSVGEFVNQIIGKARQLISIQFDLIANNNQPKAITITSSITLSIDSPILRPRCRKLCFKTSEGNAYYVEFSLDDTEFIMVSEGAEEEELDVDELMAQHRPGGETITDAGDDDEELDIEAIMAASRGDD